MARTRSLGVLLALVAACAPAVVPEATGAPAPAASQTPAPVVQSADVVWLRDQASIALVQARTIERLRALPAGAATHDWSTLFAVQQVITPDARVTHVRAIDVRTGEIRAERALAGEWFLPAVGLLHEGGLSGDGRWLALAKRRGQADTKSELVVLPADLGAAPRTVALEGSFSFDALSDDGRTLYLIEHTAVAEGKYRVRAYDLAAGRLLPGVIADKLSGGGDMRGFRVDSVTPPGSAWTLAIYDRSEGPFVHALNTRDRFAVCLFLPNRSGSGGEEQLMWSLALAPDGRTVYVVNAGLGVVSAIDVTGSAPRIRGSALFSVARADGPLDRTIRFFVPIAEAKMESRHGAAVSPDGKTLAVVGTRGIFVIDTATLALRARHFDDRVTSLAFSPDGARLYGLTGRGLYAFDAATGKVIAHLYGAAAQAFAIERVTVEP